MGDETEEEEEDTVQPSPLERPSLSVIRSPSGAEESKSDEGEPRLVVIPFRLRDPMSDSRLDEDTFHKDFTSMSFKTFTIGSPFIDRDGERWAAEQMGLNTCILGSKIVHLLLLSLLAVICFFRDSPTLAITFSILVLIDLIVLAVSVIHAVRSHLGLLLALIGVESLIAIAGIVLAIVVMWADHGRDCDQVQCSTLNLSGKERFCFFWILLIKGLLELFLSLMIVAMSPIIHDRNHDEWGGHHEHFHYGGAQEAGGVGYKDWSAFLSSSQSTTEKKHKLNKAFDEDSA